MSYGADYYGAENDIPTSKMTWAIFCLSGQDVRDSDISFDEASSIIGSLKDGKTITIGDVDYSPKVKSAEKWQELHDKAVKAGKEKAEAKVPVPMTVVERANPLDDSSEIITQYEPIPDGVCGFAWINIKPGTHSFAKWAKKNVEFADKDSYYGGVSIWVHDYNQSYEKKQAYADGYAKVINDELKDDEKFKNAFPMGRLD